MNVALPHTRAVHCCSHVGCVASSCKTVETGFAFLLFVVVGAQRKHTRESLSFTCGYIMVATRAYMKAAVDNKNVLLQADILQRILAFVGLGEFAFIATVNSGGAKRVQSFETVNSSATSSFDSPKSMRD